MPLDRLLRLIKRRRMLLHPARPSRPPAPAPPRLGPAAPARREIVLQKISQPGPPEDSCPPAPLQIKARQPGQHRPGLFQPLRRRLGLFRITPPEQAGTARLHTSQLSVTIAVTSAVPPVEASTVSASVSILVPPHPRTLQHPHQLSLTCKPHNSRTAQLPHTDCPRSARLGCRQSACRRNMDALPRPAVGCIHASRNLSRAPSASLRDQLCRPWTEPVCHQVPRQQPGREGHWAGRGPHAGAGPEVVTSTKTTRCQPSKKHHVRFWERDGARRCGQRCSEIGEPCPIS